MTLLRSVFLAGWLLPHRPCAAPLRLVTAVLRRCAKLFACHRVDHPPCPHCRSSSFLHGVRGRDWTLLISARRFPFARGRRCLRCADSVCDTLTKAPAYRLLPPKIRTKVSHHHRLLRSTFSICWILLAKSPIQPERIMVLVPIAVLGIAAR